MKNKKMDRILIILEKFLKNCTNNLNLNIEELSNFKPINDDSKIFFEKMSKLKEKTNLKELSMGMSSDYLDAVDFNASFVRIGSKIFGERI